MHWLAWLGTLVLLGGCRGACTDPASSSGPAAKGFALDLAGEPGCRFDHLVVADLPPDFDCSRLTQHGFVGAPVGVSGGLRGFCRMSIPLRDRSGDALPERDPRAAAASLLPAGARVAPDCVVVLPFSSPSTEAAGEAGTGAAPGRLDPWAEALALAGRPLGDVRLDGPKARISVIDSAPTTAKPGWLEAADAADHGVRVARVAQALGCPAPAQQVGAAIDPGGCAFEVVSQQALSRRDPRRPTGGRGHLRGSLSELAEAIDRAVEAAPRPERLVLNLSLGWDPRAGGVDTDPRRGASAAVALVLRALRVAGCRGALSVAASGPELDWVTDFEPAPLYPAGFATLTRVDTAECAAWLDAARVHEGDHALPLVLAVGAAGRFSDLEGEDARAVVLQRLGGAPNLYALGLFPSVAGGPALMGSSASAAIVSAAVGWMWATYPDHEEAAQLVRDLFRAGERMTRVPRVTLPHAALATDGRARLIRACRVLRETCGEPCALAEGELRCPPLPDPGLAIPPGIETATLPPVSGEPCPDTPRVVVFSSEEVERKAACASGSWLDPLRRPFASPRGLSPSCRRCFGRAVSGERRLRVVLDLAADALVPRYLVFTAGKNHAVHPLSRGVGDDRGLALEPGTTTALEIELPGPIPAGLEGRVFFEGPGGTLLAEILELSL